MCTRLFKILKLKMVPAVTDSVGSCGFMPFPKGVNAKKMNDQSWNSNTVSLPIPFFSGDKLFNFFFKAQSSIRMTVNKTCYDAYIIQ